MGIIGRLGCGRAGILGKDQEMVRAQDAAFPCYGTRLSAIAPRRATRGRDMRGRRSGSDGAGHLPVAGSKSELQLVVASILFFLFTHVLLCSRFISAYRRDEVSPRSQMWPNEIALIPSICGIHVDPALALDVPHHPLHGLV